MAGIEIPYAQYFNLASSSRNAPLVTYILTSCMICSNKILDNRKKLVIELSII